MDHPTGKIRDTMGSCQEVAGCDESCSTLVNPFISLVIVSDAGHPGPVAERIVLSVRLGANNKRRGTLVVSALVQLYNLMKSFTLTQIINWFQQRTTIGRDLVLLTFESLFFGETFSIPRFII